MIKEVYLEDFAYTCFAYAKRRAGMEDLSWDAFRAMSLIPVKGANIPRGVILVYNVPDAEYSPERLTIDREGRIITTYIKPKVHCAVYEGDGLISDLAFAGNNPIIRIRRMEDYEDKLMGMIHREPQGGITRESRNRETP